MLKKLLMLISAVIVAASDCNDETPCIVQDSINKKDVIEVDILTSTTESETVSDVTSQSSTTFSLTTTLVSTTSPPPTLSPSIAATDVNLICWCDMIVGVCDINCCCDNDCSFYQKLIFTHCYDSSQRYEPNICYSSNFLYRNPSSVKTDNRDGLFCIVKDNIFHKKEYKSRRVVESIAEFESLIQKRKFKFFGHRDYGSLIPLNGSYKEGSKIWLIDKGKIVPFEIPSQMFGNLCLNKIPIEFLKDVSSSCKLRTKPNSTCWKLVGQFLNTNIRIISNPQNLNSSDLQNSIQNCSTLNACLPMPLYLCKNEGQCVQLKNTSTILNPKTCLDFGLKMKINIFHNGTEGLHAANVTITKTFISVLDISVQFLWAYDENYGFVRSGNPGYLHGRPVLAGRKVIITSNDSIVYNKEGIELTSDPYGWLNSFQTNNGQCSMKRQPVQFNINEKKSCSYNFNINDFSMNGCLQMQRVILKILLGEETSNMSTLGLNKYLGVFGNSRVEHINEWVKVMLDSYPLISSSSTFVNSSNSLICRNIFSIVYINIAIAKFGSFHDPQFKIIGAMINFGEPKDLTLTCILGKCNTAENITLKIRSIVSFFDISRPAVREFAHPPGLEAKLPHDFFYPFFSGNAIMLKFDIFMLVNVCFLHFCVVLK